MSSRVRAAIEAAIRERGPITFAEYMELALYGPGGYYHGLRVGPRGDFVTSPHVHPVFGTLLGRAVRSLWDALGRGTPLRLTEVGAGDGTLARQLLAELQDVPLDYAVVEVGAQARRALASLEGVRLLDRLPTCDVVLAHELLDNLPFRVIRDGREVRIGLDETGEPTPVLAPLDDELARAGISEGIVPVGALRFVDEVAEAVGQGFALLIDYAGPAEVHGYRGHHVVADVLAEPGSADITAGVDLEAIARHARARGLVAHAPVTQRAALSALGFGAWARGELDRQRALLDGGDGRAAVRAWAGRSAASLLVDPAGLGRMRWLLLATPGLPRPSWLEEAAGV